MFTLNGALAVGAEDRIGSLEPGKLADFIVLDRNILEIPVAGLRDTIVERTVVGGDVVFDREEAEADLEVVDIEITNRELDNAVDAAALNLIVKEEFVGASCRCCAIRPPSLRSGSAAAPDPVNRAFGALEKEGYEPARPARQIYWEKSDATYWIQWTLKDETATLFAYDPEVGEAVEVLKVRERR